jgi:hypothetical protein
MCPADRPGPEFSKILAETIAKGMHEIGCRTNSFCLISLRQRHSCSQQSGRALRNLDCRQGYPLLPRIQVTSHRRRRLAAGDIELRIAFRTAPCRCMLEAFSLRRQRRPDSLRVSSRASSTSVSAEKELGVDPQNLTGLVESSMLAACTGLAYHFSASFRLESYVGALFPFPVVLAAARWGCRTAWKTLASHAIRQGNPLGADWSRSQVTTSLLLLLLGGPLRSATYILLHGAHRTHFQSSTSTAHRLHLMKTGSLGITIGMLWSQKRHWLLSVPATAVVSDPHMWQTTTSNRWRRCRFALQESSARCC